MKLIIHCEDRPWTQAKAFWLVTEDERGNRHVAKPIEFIFAPVEAGASMQPTMEFSGHMSREFFPAFHAAMVESGYLKPVKDESLASVKYHLEDMRKLVFKASEGELNNART